MRCIFTGPGSATKNTPGPTPNGRPCIAVSNDARRVEPEMIAWAAIMVSISCYNLIKLTICVVFLGMVCAEQPRFMVYHRRKILTRAILGCDSSTLQDSGQGLDQ
jgi:hypothetical protein